MLYRSLDLVSAETGALPARVEGYLHLRAGGGVGLSGSGVGNSRSWLSQGQREIVGLSSTGLRGIEGSKNPGFRGLPEHHDLCGEQHGVPHKEP